MSAPFITLGTAPNSEAGSSIRATRRGSRSTRSPRCSVGSVWSRKTRAHRAPGSPDPVRRRVALFVAPAVAVLGLASPATAATKARAVATSARIASLESAVRAAPSDGRQWLALGSAYVRRAYETADPAFYPRAESSLSRAEKSLGRSPDVLSAQANLALARHRFIDAHRLASSIVSVRPGSVEGQLALFDATIELGHYDDAESLINSLVEQRPTVATLSRLSYSRQLRGDLRGAEIAMREAVSAAAPGSFDRAVALGYLGDVLLESGRLDAASRAYDDARQIEPTLATAVLGQARVYAARGDVAAAGNVLDRLIDRLPLPGALGLRADLSRASKDSRAATSTDQLVDASVALFRANGAVVDAELAVLLADRDSSHAAEAVRTAERALADRHTIFTDDAMAWSLFAANRVKDAELYARRAIAAAPAVASVRWHAAAVFAAVGDTASARNELRAALRNPWFSPSQRPAIEALAKKLNVPLPVSTSLNGVPR
jgi:tetratricopeptide (TPR) repeat protein